MIDAEVVRAARKLRPSAVTAILQDNAPGVYRIAYALAGRWDVGRGIARFVLNRSVKMMPKWKPADDPANWYHRYTIMTSRRSLHHRPASAARDVLVEQALSPDPPYIAFVAALRQLEPQQREAFLLHYCEHLNARYSALAMDCSTEAAENHLKAADQALRLVAAGGFDGLARKLTDAYAHLTPDPNDLLPTVSRTVFRQVRLRQWFGRLILLVMLVIFAALVWTGWKLYHMSGN